MIIDASVALKWFLLEHLRPEAMALLARTDIVAPDIIVPEVANGLRKAVVAQRLPQPVAMQAFGALARVFPALYPSTPLAAVALDMALTLRHPTYDCLYLAMAEVENDVVVTADAAFVATVAASQWAGRVAMLGAP